MKIIIAGAGIGGLSTAVALKKIGLQASVYERAPEIREAGAGFTIWANAMKALRRIGLEDQVRSLGAVLTAVHTYSPGGKIIYSMDVGSTSRTCGADSLCIHRADLQRTLAEALDPDQIITDYECIGVETATTTGKHRILFADGSAEEADIVIGADGLNSTVRETLFGLVPPRYAGYYCYRAITEAPGLPVNEAYFCLKAGMQIGFFPFGRPGQTYWFVCPNAPRNRAHPDSRYDHRSFLLETARALPPHLAEIIANTDPERYIIGNIADRPPGRIWGRNGITLLGDAAHPTTPNLGQGACMAIEDAIVLADQLSHNADPVRALRAYERIRYRRTAAVTRNSRNAGKLYQMENSLLIALRTGLFRLPVTDWISRIMQTRFMRYDPPELQSR